MPYNGSVSLVGFCEGARTILLAQGSQISKVSLTTISPALHAVVDASQRLTGSSPKALLEALKSEDSNALRACFADAVQALLENPRTISHLWKILRPDGFLLETKLFKSDLERVVRSGNAWLTWYPHRAYDSTPIPDGVSEPESLLDLVGATRVFFDGAAQYAYLRGALDIAERLLWWGVIAAEFKGKPISDQTLKSLHGVYRHTGRLVSNERISAIHGASSRPKDYEAWQRKIEVFEKKAVKVWCQFLNVEGDFQDLRSSLAGLSEELNSLAAAMERDLITRPLVAMPVTKVISPESLSETRPENFELKNLESNGGFFYRSEHFAVVPPGNPLLEHLMGQLPRHAILQGEQEAIREWPRPLIPLAQTYRRALSIVITLEAHAEAVRLMLNRFPNPVLDEVISAFKALPGEGSERNLRTGLALLGWACHCLRRPLAGRSAVSLEAYRKEIKNAYAEGLEKLRQQVEASLLSPSAYTPAQNMADHDDSVEVNNNFDTQSLLQILEEAPTSDPSTLRALAPEMVRRRKEILVAWRDKGSDLGKLAALLCAFWKKTPESVDLALWASELYQLNGQIANAHDILMKALNFLGNCPALSLKMNEIAATKIYS